MNRRSFLKRLAGVVAAAVAGVKAAPASTNAPVAMPPVVDDYGEAGVFTLEKFRIAFDDEYRAAYFREMGKGARANHDRIVVAAIVGKKFAV